MVASKVGSIVVAISFLSLITLTASCRQHRTPKVITFKRTIKSDDRLSEDEKNIKDTDIKPANREYFNLTDTLLQTYIPARLSHCPEQIIHRQAYILSYNKETKLPNWVAWHLTSGHTEGQYKRLNVYFEDSDVPMPRASDKDYQGTNWTHGHMCPAGDNKWDMEAMKESNFLTNICPQDRQLNTGLWNRIEQDCRTWAKKYGDIYIVCGPVLMKKEHETIGRNQVVVPEAFFKVILCLRGTPKALGYVIRNNEGKKKRDQFFNTVDEVERITGIDFFPSLPDSIENRVESHSNLELW